MLHRDHTATFSVVFLPVLPFIKRKIVSLFQQDKFDCILQIFNMKNIILEKKKPQSQALS